MTFGVFLRQLREEKALRQSDLAEAIGVSTVYVCDIEKDRRYPPDLEKLRIWERQLHLSTEESGRLYDLAGEARSSVAPDIIDYLEANPAAKQAIRRIMGHQNSYDWNMV